MNRKNQEIIESEPKNKRNKKMEIEAKNSFKKKWKKS